MSRSPHRKWCTRHLCPWILLTVALTMGCATTPRSSGGIEVPAPRGLYPPVVSAGDVVSVAYFLDAQVQAEAYRIGVGDELRVEVADHPDLVDDGLIVLPDGRISVKLIGALDVVGKTVDEVGREAAARYRERKIRDPQVVVSVKDGQYRLKQFMGALLNASGGNRTQLKVYSDETLVLPFIPPVATGRPLIEIRQEILAAYAKEFGEQLEVTVNLQDRQTPAVHVMGEVQRPGSVELSQRSNLLTAIAMAGGFTDQAAPEEVLVLRFAADGGYTHRVFDVKSLLLPGGEREGGLRLQPDDVIYVAKSRIAKVDQFVEQYIRRVLPFDFSVGASYGLGGLDAK